VSVRPSEADVPAGPRPSDPELGVLFHRLNNQLGIILAHAELLEARAVDEAGRARSAKVVTGTLEAMATVRQIRHISELIPA
jgi:hypothetical protein